MEPEGPPCFARQQAHTLLLEECHRHHLFLCAYSAAGVPVEGAFGRTLPLHGRLLRALLSASGMFALDLYTGYILFADSQPFPVSHLWAVCFLQSSLISSALQLIYKIRNTLAS